MLGFSIFSSFSTHTEILHWGKSKADVCTTTCVRAPPSYSWQRKHGTWLWDIREPTGPSLPPHPASGAEKKSPSTFGDPVPVASKPLSRATLCRRYRESCQSSAGILLSHSCSSYQLLSASWGCLSCSASVGVCLYSRLLSGGWKLLCHTNKVMLW